mgnify:CR=1 FL=1
MTGVQTCALPIYLNDYNATLIPSLRIGTPFTLGENGTETAGTILAKFGTFVYGGTTKGKVFTGNGSITYLTSPSAGQVVTVQKFSDRALIPSPGGAYTGVLISYGKTVADLKKVVYSTNSSASPRLHGFDYFNYDIRGLSDSVITGVNGSLALGVPAGTRIITTGTDVDTFYAVSLFNASNNGNIPSFKIGRAHV